MPWEALRYLVYVKVSVADPRLGVSRLITIRPRDAPGRDLVIVADVFNQVLLLLMANLV